MHKWTLTFKWPYVTVAYVCAFCTCVYVFSACQAPERMTKCKFMVKQNQIGLKTEMVNVDNCRKDYGSHTRPYTSTFVWVCLCWPKSANGIEVRESHSLQSSIFVVLLLAFTIHSANANFFCWCISASSARMRNKSIIWQTAYCLLLHLAALRTSICLYICIYVYLRSCMCVIGDVHIAVVDYCMRLCKRFCFTTLNIFKSILSKSNRLGVAA